MLVETLRSQDRLSILLYDHQVDVLFELTDMNDHFKKKAINLIEEVNVKGSTNIYSAVQKAVEIIENRTDKQRNPAIMLFTDGQPN